MPVIADKAMFVIPVTSLVIALGMTFDSLLIYRILIDIISEMFPVISIKHYFWIRWLSTSPNVNLTENIDYSVCEVSEFDF